MSGGPVRLDLHVHSTRSVDGHASLAALVGRASAMGLGGFALTDHNTVVGHAELRELQRRFPELLLIPGVEVSTREGHLLVYGVGELPPRGEPLEATVRWATERGGFASVAHPFRWPHGSGRAGVVAGDGAGVEGINGHSTTAANRKATAAARQHRRTSTGGSDAHRASDLGRAFTTFPSGTDSVDAALRALREGKVGPEGSSLGRVAWLAWALRAAVTRLGRGLPPV